MYTKLLNIFIILTVIFIITYIFFNKKEENFTELTQKEKLAVSILNFIKEDSNYIDYLTFLTNNPDNLSEILLQEQIFYDFLFKKKNNSLKINDILDKITDM